MILWGTPTLCKTMNTTVCIVDFLNVFSDYREILYKQKNIDFHSVKHTNREDDTRTFFKMFFGKYIHEVNIPQNSIFIFITKKLNQFQNIFEEALLTYTDIDVRFLVIENKFNDDILDKNKDDFVCQYMFHLFAHAGDCVLVSNDKYRDKNQYVQMFDKINTQIVFKQHKLCKTDNKVVSTVFLFKMIKMINQKILCQACKRNSIPKAKLGSVIELC